jgi:putative mycofactocin binding protein MftB
MPPVATPADTDFDASRPWALHPQVTLRPEPFGALAYHFGTRRLSFLKSPTLVAVVKRLAGAPTAEAACRSAGVGPAELPGYERALGTLAASGMIRPRDDPGTMRRRRVLGAAGDGGDGKGER